MWSNHPGFFMAHRTVLDITSLEKTEFLLSYEIYPPCTQCFLLFQ